MRFTLKQLRYFDAALRTGSITRAATEMNISQSSITAAIDAIEQTTGSELFRRIPAKGLLVTETGKKVGQTTAAFLEQARIFESDLLSLKDGPAGTLRLACYAPTAPYVLPPLLKQVAKDYPSIRIDLKEGDMRDINELLYSGAVDIALTYRRYTPESQPFIPMFRARPWALLPTESPLADRKHITLKDLAELPMILLDLPATNQYFRDLFGQSGLYPNIVHTTKSSSVLRGLVAANFGYSLLNICGPNDRDGRNGYIAIPLRGTLDEPQFGIAYTQASQRSPMIQAVLSICSNITQLGVFDHLIMSA